MSDHGDIDDVLGIHDERRSRIALIQQLKSKAKPTTRKRKIPSEEDSLKNEERRKRRNEAKLRKFEEEQGKIIVGVDFGTTFTGIAYGSTKLTHKDVKIITRWSGGNNDTEQKCPTRLAYAAENLFQEDNDRWGYDVAPDMMSCQWFKLLLDAGTRRTDYDDPLLEQSTGSSLMRLPTDKTALDVATDFLRLVYEHILDSLASIIGNVALSETTLHFELSTPATWSLAARQATRTAAQNAGFCDRARDDLVLVDEPECAAIYSIKSIIKNFDVGPFKQNTCVTIVDLGGGTVDLITYRIIKTEPNLQLEEACVGQGGKCGGTTIDRNLHELMSKRFNIAFDDLPPVKIAVGSYFMKAFEIIKRDFSGDRGDGKIYELPLKMRKLDHDDPEIQKGYDFEEDMVRITSGEIERMFDPVIEKTFALVRKQANRTSKAKSPAIKAIILCGGLGSNAYVRKKFKEYIAGELKGSVELVTPEEPWSAIARGAATRGLEKSPVMFRRVRDHIGIVVHEAFDARKHMREDYFTCPIEGARAANQMRWQVLRGEKVSTDTKRCIDCYCVVSEEEAQERVVKKYQYIYACSKNDPPTRRDPQSTDVYRIGRVEIDLTNLVKQERKRINLAGETLVDMNFDVTIELTMAADKGVMLVAVKQDRKVLGRSSLEYESNPAWRGTLIAGDD